MIETVPKNWLEEIQLDSCSLSLCPTPGSAVTPWNAAMKTQMKSLSLLKPRSQLERRTAARKEQSCTPDG
ncbi:hypothetical protein STEG23_024830, partial [Scotinomys teguina]